MHMLKTTEDTCGGQISPSRTRHDGLLDDDIILNSKDRWRQAPQQSSRYRAHLTLLDLSSRSSCPLHGQGDAAGRSSPPAVESDASVGHHRCRTSFLYDRYSSKNPNGNMASPCRGEYAPETPSSLQRYGWIEPEEGQTRCSSRSWLRSRSRHPPVPARKCPRPESTREVKQRRGPLKQQSLPGALAFPPPSALDGCIDSEKSCRSRTIVLAEAPLEDISPEILQEPPWPPKRSETGAASSHTITESGVQREQGYDASAHQNEVQACQEAERASRVHKYPGVSQRWYTRLEKARSIKHTLGRALSYNKGLRESNSEMVKMVGALLRRVENLLSSESSSSLSQSTRKSTSGSQENFLEQVQGEMNTAIEGSRRRNEKSKILQKGEEYSDASSRRDSSRDAGEVSDANDHRGPSAKQIQQRLRATSACIDGEIYCTSLEKVAATDVAFLDKNQSHLSKSTSHSEEMNARVDGTTSPCSSFQSLATDTNNEEAFRSKKFEPPETEPAVITEMKAKVGTDSHGSDPHQETARRPVDISSIAKPTNKSETVSSTSWDREGKLFDAKSILSTSARASAHADVVPDTGDSCGNVWRMANSCIAEQVTSASRTPRPGRQRTGSSLSLEALDEQTSLFAVYGDDIQAFSPFVEVPETPKRVNGAMEATVAPEPEGSMHGGTSQKQNGDTLNSSPIDEAPNKVDNQVKKLQRELYRARRSLAALKILFLFSRNSATSDNPPLTMDDRALEVALAFARWRHQNRIAAAREETPFRLLKSSSQATSSKRTREQQPPLNISVNDVKSEKYPAEEAQQAARNMEVRRSTISTPMPPMPLIPPSSQKHRSASSMINIITRQGVEDTQKAHKVLHPAKQEERAREVEIYQSPQDEGADHGRRCAAGAREQNKIAHGQNIHQNRDPVVWTISEERLRSVREAAGASDSYRYNVGLKKVDEARRQNDEQHQVIGIEDNEEHVRRQWEFGSQQQRDWSPEGEGRGEVEQGTEKKEEGQENMEDGEMGDEEVNGDGVELEEKNKAEEDEEEQAEVKTATDESHGEGKEIDDDEAKRLFSYRRDCAVLAGTAKIVLALAALEHRKISSCFYRWKRMHRYADVNKA